MRLYDVVMFLKKQGYALENTYISYYSCVFSAYVNCSLDPVSKTIWLTDDDLELIDEKLSLRLKFQKGLCRQFTDDDVEVDEEESCSVARSSAHDEDFEDAAATQRHRIVG